MLSKHSLGRIIFKFIQGIQTEQGLQEALMAQITGGKPPAKGQEKYLDLTERLKNVVRTYTNPETFRIKQYLEGVPSNIHMPSIRNDDADDDICCIYGVIQLHTKCFIITKMFIPSTFYQLFFLGKVFVTLASAPSNLCELTKFAEMPHSGNSSSRLCSKQTYKIIALPIFR